MPTLIIVLLVLILVLVLRCPSYRRGKKKRTEDTFPDIVAILN